MSKKYSQIDFGGFGLAYDSSNESQGFCYYIIIIVDKQAVHTRKARISQISKVAQRKYCGQRKQINIVTSVHYLEISF